jgi:hypothetical protein
MDFNLLDLMDRLDGLIRELNPYYTGFRQMNQELIEAEQRAAQSDIPFIEPKMYLVHRTNEERGRYNDPVNTSEMAVVFTGADGVPPEGNRIRIYPNDGPLREISDCNANRDPMIYPLLFPRGELGKIYFENKPYLDYCNFSTTTKKIHRIHAYKKIFSKSIENNFRAKVLFSRFLCI